MQICLTIEKRTDNKFRLTIVNSVSLHFVVLYKLRGKIIKSLYMVTKRSFFCAELEQELQGRILDIRSCRAGTRAVTKVLGSATMN